MFEDWLAKEDDLWHTTIRQFPVWVLIRYRVLRVLDVRQRTLDDKPTVSKRVHLERQRWGRYLRTLAWMLNNKQWQTTFIVRNANRQNDSLNYSFDRLYNSFYTRIPDALILEISAERHWPRPDRYYRHAIMSQDLFWILANRLADSITPVQLSSQEKHQISDFAAQVSNVFELPDLQKELEDTITTLLKRSQMIQRFTRRFIIERLQRPVVFMEEASYLGRSAIVTHALHQHGITVIEPQHGFVSRTHPAYNLPETVLADHQHPARAFLPDVFLTFGEYWSHIIRLPVKKVVIGSPYLSQLAQRASDNIEENDHQILIISSYIVTERTIALAQQIAEALPEFQLIVKLHPQEVARQTRFEEALPDANTTVIGQGNVYDLIAQSKIIVSLYSSTVLAEAVAFDQKRIFCSEVGDYPAEMTHHFTTADELIALIRDSQTGYPQVDPAQFWAPDWEHRLEDFLAGYFPDSAFS